MMNLKFLIIHCDFLFFLPVPSLLMKRVKKGFTLIELLIVVAIIAILAAIAVPNFLEAQIRAKVSKVRSDFRTISLALESYAVDANSYPDFSEAGIRSTPPTIIYHRYLPSRITTPIPYISNILYDEFRERFIPRNLTYIPPEIYYRYGYSLYDPHFGYSTVFEDWIFEYGCWYIFSWGPDRLCNKKYDHDSIYDDKCNLHGLQGFFTPYDPTNGTVSWGNIFRTQVDPNHFKVNLINP